MKQYQSNFKHVSHFIDDILVLTRNTNLVALHVVPSQLAMQIQQYVHTCQVHTVHCPTGYLLGSLAVWGAQPHSTQPIFNLFHPGLITQ